MGLLTHFFNYENVYDMWVIIPIIIISAFILFAVAVIILRIRSSRHDKSLRTETGKSDGEILVAEYLTHFASITGGYIFNDFTFKEYGGRSTQIDHILITRGGLFVIETKSHRGEIHGSINDTKWMCNKSFYKNDSYLDNPIRQNDGHIFYLKKILGKSAPRMYSVIIFPFADILNIHEKCVYDLEGALKYIREMTVKEKYPQAFADRMYKKLVFIQDRFGITTKQHVQNMKSLHKE